MGHLTNHSKALHRYLENLARQENLQWYVKKYGPPIDTIADDEHKDPEELPKLEGDPASITQVIESWPISKKDWQLHYWKGLFEHSRHSNAYLVVVLL